MQRIKNTNVVNHKPFTECICVCNPINNDSVGSNGIFHNLEEVLSNFAWSVCYHPVRLYICLSVPPPYISVHNIYYNNDMTK